MPSYELPPPYDGPERRRDVAVPGLPVAWLAEQFAGIREDVRERHDRIRVDLTNGLRDITGALAQHARAGQAVENRVLVMETERHLEEKQTNKRGAVAGILGATGAVAGWEVIKRAMGWP